MSSIFPRTHRSLSDWRAACQPRRLVAEYRRPGARLADYLPGLVDKGVVLNRDGSFQCSVTFRGPDLHALPAELVGVAGRLNKALSLRDHCCVNVK